MNIQLKNIKIAANLSEETTAFTADLYINNIKAGYCKNSGQGGSTDYHPYALEHRVLITDAEKYCEGLPDQPIPSGDRVIMIKMNLENFIDDLILKFLIDKDKQKFLRGMERDMKKSIVVGTDTSYRCFNLNKPLEEILRFHSNPVAFLNEVLINVAKKLKSGERILNTNFPQGVIIPEMQKA